MAPSTLTARTIALVSTSYQQTRPWAISPVDAKLVPKPLVRATHHPSCTQAPSDLENHRGLARARIIPSFRDALSPSPRRPARVQSPRTRLGPGAPARGLVRVRPVARGGGRRRAATRIWRSARLRVQHRRLLQRSGVGQPTRVVLARGRLCRQHGRYATAAEVRRRRARPRPLSRRIRSITTEMHAGRGVRTSRRHRYSPTREVLSSWTAQVLKPRSDNRSLLQLFGAITIRRASTARSASAGSSTGAPRSCARHERTLAAGGRGRRSGGGQLRENHVGVRAVGLSTLSLDTI